METLKFNNQPKVEIEKTPQENEGLLNGQEQESGKRENIILEIDGQKIEAVKYYFEYPERIQKETGILGYERTKVTDKNFFNFYKKKTENFLNGVSLEQLGVFEYRDIINFIEDARLFFEYKKRWTNSVPERFKNFENIIEIDLIVEAFLGFSDKLTKLTLSLSNQEYPYKCLNHFIGGFASYKQTQKYQQNFAMDRFFLQKIYDVERISKEEDNKELFDHSGGSKFHIFKHTSNIKITEKLLRPRHIVDHLEDIGKDIYLVSEKGFNVSPGKFWYDMIRPHNISFGFSPFEDSFMKDYFEKVSKELLSLGFSKENDGVKTSCDISLVNKYIDKNGKDWLWKESINNIVGDTLLSEDGYPPDKLRSEIDETYIPIFIGHKKIPQLSWGHAKYAHYFNDKSFNFFKFKHADHLPVKEEVASSDS